ncbi:hypothetical protein MNBD_NITROSPIRAE03-1276 [hydrothermal vent metagenome]|uniref:Uncharacterized protein n=1 Tax=hydrothermal vent metagenome TaxID=652676 RepID=A0A3B1DXY9_9ZZZZ
MVKVKERASGLTMREGSERFPEKQSLLFSENKVKNP